MLNVNTENAIEILMQEVKTDTSNAHKIIIICLGLTYNFLKVFRYHGNSGTLHQFITWSEWKGLTVLFNFYLDRKSWDSQLTVDHHLHD